MKRFILAAALLPGACVTNRPACPVDELAAAAIGADRSPAEFIAAHPGCPEADLTTAYRQVLAERCAPRVAWREGLEGQPPSGLCRGQGGRLWIEAYNLGQGEREFSAELARLEAQIAVLARSEDEADQAAARRAGLQRVRLIRELDAIRGAAKIRGWSEEKD